MLVRRPCPTERDGRTHDQVIPTPNLLQQERHFIFHVIQRYFSPSARAPLLLSGYSQAKNSAVMATALSASIVAIVLGKRRKGDEVDQRLMNITSSAIGGSN